MAVVYLDREGKRISKEAWTKHRADHAYKVVREYDNGAVRVTLEWIGRIADYGMVYPEFHKTFKIGVMNYTSEGSLAPDPVERDRTFDTEVNALKFYEEFLTKWTDSGVDEFGDFQEADNALVPPPPPDPDAPTIEPDAPELGGVGAW